MAHYEERLERDLKQISERVSQLASHVENGLTNAIQSVQTGNDKLAYLTILGDGRINHIHRDLDRLCYRFIALHLPSAGHLRRLSATIRINLQLERIGDYAVTIAREGVQLKQPPEGAIAREIERTGEEVCRMLQLSMEAFMEGNEEAARVTKSMADHMEHDMNSIYADLMVEGDRTRIKRLLAIFVIFNMLKRVSDQAKNLCEETIFAETGESKTSSIKNVLFLDDDNSCLSPMAEAIAQKTFPGRMEYHSAGGGSPAAKLNPQMLEFMRERGIELDGKAPIAFEPETLEQYYLVISMQGAAGRYLSDIPFHTSVLEWDVGPTPEAGDDEGARQYFEEIYRGIAVNLQELIELMYGENES